VFKDEAAKNKGLSLWRRKFSHQTTYELGEGGKRRFGELMISGLTKLQIVVPTHWNLVVGRKTESQKSERISEIVQKVQKLSEDEVQNLMYKKARRLFYTLGCEALAKSAAYDHRVRSNHHAGNAFQPAPIPT